MSACRYCQDEIVWIARKDGGWFPPFDAVPELENVEYVVAWDREIGDWAAAPLDVDLQVKMRRHRCAQRTEAMEQDRANWAVLLDREEPVSRTEPPKIIVREVVVNKAREPEAYVKAARRLAVPCPTCKARKFEWCHYLEEPEKMTKQMHTTRVGKP